MSSKQNFHKSLWALAKNKLKRVIPIHQISTASIIDYNKLILFSWAQGDMPSLIPRSDLEIRKLTPKEFSILVLDSGRFAEQAKLYYVKRGIESAYGAYINEKLAHISWVYTNSEYLKEPFQRLILDDCEAEIVNCFTLPEYRGLGIYPYMIQFLSNIQFQNGIERVYMMADHQNFASQRGIIKAGLKPCGQVVYVRIPASSSKSIYYRRKSLSFPCRNK